MFDSLDGLFSAMALTFVLLLALAAIGIFVWLGSLPGSIAAKRGHPQAEAITACGWLGLITGVLWPIAFVWAFTNCAGSRTGASSAESR